MDMKNLYEFSDILQSPIEAFICAAENIRFPVEAHWHYFVEIIYMTDGAITVTCNDVPYHMEPDDVLVIPPQSVHAFYAENGQPYRYLCFKFNLDKIHLVGSYLPALSDAFHQISNIEVPPICFHANDFPQISIRDLFLTVHEEVTCKNYGYNSFAYSEFSIFLLQLLRKWHNMGISFEQNKVPEIEEQTIRNALVYIDRHSHENINIAQLAHLCNMSYSYFAKVFRKLYGQSCKQYIEFVRLNKVENLLLFTDYDLNFISSETGFADCSHLIRTFKKRYQMTPKQFRKQHTAVNPLS